MESLELVWLFGNASFATPMLCQTKRTFAHNKKNMPLHASSSSTTAPPDHSTTHMFSTCPTMNLRNLQHPCLRSPAICTRVPASFASLVFAHFHSCAFRHNTILSTLHSANNDASSSKRRRRDRHNNRWAKAERSRLDNSCRAFYFGAQAQSSRKTINSCSRQQGGDLAVA